jgi:hypothetical protein
MSPSTWFVESRTGIGPTPPAYMTSTSVAPVPAGVVTCGVTFAGGVTGCMHPAIKRTIARVMQTTMREAIFFICRNVDLSIFIDSF